MQPWICPRCQVVHAPWVAQCACKPISLSGALPYPSQPGPAQPLPMPPYDCQQPYTGSPLPPVGGSVCGDDL
jgi:hypothetical protein